MTENKHEAIKSQLLQDIQDAQNPEDRFDRTRVFRNFVEALEAEAKTREADARAMLMNLQGQKEAAARNGHN